MNFEQLKSGKYRATIMKNGKRYRITYDTKPSKKQAEEDLYNLIAKTGNDYLNDDLTFLDAAKKYVDMKRNVLSPSTIREYVQMYNRMPDWFLRLAIDDISQIEINKFVNELSINRSPKTVRNYHGFMTAVLGTFRPHLKIYTTLPQKRKTDIYIPSDDDVKKILAEVKGTDFYIPIVLACYGMRRGEICALTVDDLEGDIVHINKSLAQNEHNEYVLKSTKTTESERDIIIPIDIADMIRQKGYVYKMNPNSLACKLPKILKKLGIPHFSFHKFRHYFASKMLTITDVKTVQALGGWKTDSVLKTVYAHSMKDEQEKAKRAAVATLSGSIF